MTYNKTKEHTMNSVDTFVLQSMRSYPSIFPTREEVLSHALFVIGNGIPWVNGEFVSDRLHITMEAGLVRFDDELTKDRERVDDMLADINDNEDMTDIATEMYARAAAWYDDDRKVVINADTLAVIKCPVAAANVGYYGQGFSTYSNIYNTPQDVTSEWLEACYEAAEWVKAENPHYTDIIAHLDAVKEHQATA
tara:strand:- start:109 stop:690 length:582 start_codon:yes stop_codon:yes gene_type:complete